MRRFITVLALPVACFFSGAHAQDYHFDAALLGGSAKDIDLSLFSQGLQQPGTYQMDVILNGSLVDRQDINLRIGKNASGDRQLIPCLSLKQLSRWGVKTDDWPGLLRAPGSPSCIRLNAIPQAGATADVPSLQLGLEIPQAALRPQFGGLAPEELWDDGITAFLMNYSAGTSRTDGDARRSETTSWAQLQPGFNVGAWRARSEISGQSGERWQRLYTYAERGIKRFRSRLTLGERATPDEVFDSVPFTGAMLATDEAMVPVSERSFAPAVSGVARTRARIEVRQNGYLLKTLQVAPGPFDIQDLPGRSGGGDLQVTVYEADGRNQVFMVPWQTPAVALHAGHMKYSLTAGRYRPADHATMPAPLAQGTIIYGLPWNLTTYGGLQGTSHYSAASLGLGASMGKWGALSVDGTGARSQLPSGVTQQGATWRVRYSSRIGLTGTGFSLASTQYASPGYRSLTQTLDAWQKEEGRFAADYTRQQRARTTMSLNQPLGALGNLTLSASRIDWRGSRGRDYGTGLSWSTSIRDATVSVNWQQNRLSGSCRDSALSLWLSIPLGYGTNASWSLQAPSRGPQEQLAGLSGHALDDRLTWDVRERYRAGVPAEQRSSSNLHLGWSGTYGQAGMSYGYSPSSRQAEADVSGGIIVHRHGVTFSQPLSDTIALVSAPGVAGAKVGGWPGVSTDIRGYTTTSGLIAYQENTVSLDPTALPDNAEVPQTDVKVVPSTGAVVQAAFRARTGARALVTLRHPDGTPVVFGAQITAEGTGGGAGLADGNGLAYLTGLPPHGTLRVHEGTGDCSADYRLPAQKGPAGLYELSAVCRAAAGNRG